MEAKLRVSIGGGRSMGWAFSYSCCGTGEIMCHDNRPHKFDQRCKHRDGGEARSIDDTTSTAIIVPLGSQSAHCHTSNQGTVFVG